MTIATMLITLFSFLAPPPPGSVPDGIRKGPNPRGRTHVETWCYGNSKCTGGAQKVETMSQCKGEHKGVRLVIVYDNSGKIFKNGACIPGEFIEIPPTREPGQVQPK